MKFFLNKAFIIILFVFVSSAKAEIYESKYDVSSSGLKIGHFVWTLEIKEGLYKTKINLENSGIFSPLYKFKGEYSAQGKVFNNNFKAEVYTQDWRVKKKSKKVNILFYEKGVDVRQEPNEKEHARINFDGLKLHFDPITSFINIIKGHKFAQTIDGRRIYTMKRIEDINSKKITLEIENYTNIWADHKRNDVKKIEFITNEENFLPLNISVFFKERKFVLKKK